MKKNYFELQEDLRCGTCLWFEREGSNYVCGYFRHDAQEKGGIHNFPEALRPVLIATGGLFITGPQRGRECAVWGFNRNLL